MTETSVSELVNLLSSSELRIRTGVLELPVGMIGQERELSVQLGLGWLDLVDFKLLHGAQNTGFIDLSIPRIFEDIETALRMPSFGTCVLVSSVDVMLSALTADDRRRFWLFFREHFKQTRGLILVLPADAMRLFSFEERAVWLSAGRLAVWKGVSPGYYSEDLLDNEND